MFAIILVILGYIKEILTFFFVVSLHELAHAFVAKKLGYKLTNFKLLPYGVSLSYKEFTTNANHEIAIAIAGPLFNIALCVVIVALWWGFPITYVYTDFLCKASFVTAVFNFLPAFPLDGGRVLVGILSHKIKREKSIKISCVFNVILTAFFLILFCMSLFIKPNFTFITISIFLFAGIIEGKNEGEYQRLSFKDFGDIKHISGVKVQAFLASTPLYKIVIKMKKNKFNVFFVIFANGSVKLFSQIQLAKMAEKFELSNSIQNIIKN
ncbi:MAG: hypothetical protein RR140_01195 [Clostridia bacterium]